jgi:hypothetical protein
MIQDRDVEQFTTGFELFGKPDVGIGRFYVSGRMREGFRY